jgi:hypothetical protein
MTARLPEGSPSGKGLPLFMRQHTITDNRDTMPREGVDFTYDAATQKASWNNPNSTNKWSSTDFGDTKVDGVDYIAINLEPTDE